MSWIWDYDMDAEKYIVNGSEKACDRCVYRFICKGCAHNIKNRATWTSI